MHAGSLIAHKAPLRPNHPSMDVTPALARIPLVRHHCGADDRLGRPQDDYCSGAAANDDRVREGGGKCSAMAGDVSG